MGKLEDLALCEEEIAHLQDVHAVHVVVVSDVASVALVDLANETRQLVLVHAGKFVNVEVLEHVDGQHREGRLATKLAAEGQRVEVDVLSLAQGFLVLLDVVHDSVQTRSATD